MDIFQKAIILKKLHQAHLGGFDNFLNDYTNQSLSERIADAIFAYNNALIHSNGYGIHDHTHIKNFEFSCPVAIKNPRIPNKSTITWDAESPIFAADKFDLIISQNILHRCNNLMTSLKNYHDMLKANGVFLAVLPAGNSLMALKSLFLEAELADNNGISPRFIPFATAEQMANMLSKTGFQTIITDTETLTINYKNYQAMHRDLKSMAEGLYLNIPKPKKLARFMHTALNNLSYPYQVEIELVYCHGVKRQ